MPMNDDLKSLAASENDNDVATLGMSSVYRLFEAFIGMREKNERQHKVFEQTLTRARDTLQSSFNSFAADTQKAFQNLRNEVHGEKRFSLSLLNELLDLAIELDHIVASRPAVNWHGDEVDSVNRYMDSIEVQNRKIQESLRTFGVHPYDAIVGAARAWVDLKRSMHGLKRAWMALKRSMHGRCRRQWPCRREASKMPSAGRPAAFRKRKAYTTLSFGTIPRSEY
ncbi:MAG: hypothetical protein WCL32_22380, partial [Planctomycetota bacterium]